MPINVKLWFFINNKKVMNDFYVKKWQKKWNKKQIINKIEQIVNKNKTNGISLNDVIMNKN